jgi:hypothetical protein
MQRHFPIDDPRLGQALKIAMQYLELKGLTEDYYMLQKYVALQIRNEWQRGTRHRAGPGCLNRTSAWISGVSAGVRPPSGMAAG